MNNNFSLAEAESIIREVVESGGEFELYPRGTSMLPLIKEGRDSVILVKAPERLSVFDIALYRRDDGRYVLHRVVAAENGTYTMRGDNQTVAEPGVRSDQIIAVVARLNIDGKSVDVTFPKYKKWVRRWQDMRKRRVMQAFYRIKRKVQKR